MPRKQTLPFYNRPELKKLRIAIEQQENINHILDLIELRPNDTLLDIGCGAGNFIREAGTKCQAWGVDPFPLSNAKNIIRGIAEKLPFREKNIFSVIYFSKSFMLINREKAFKEIKRVLKPNGKLVIRELLYSPGWDKIIAGVKNKFGLKNITLKSHDQRDQEMEKVLINNLEAQGLIINNIHHFKTYLVYASRKLLIERFINFSPLVNLNLKKSINKQDIEKHLKKIVVNFYGPRNNTTVYNNLLIIARKP